MYSAERRRIWRAMRVLRLVVFALAALAVSTPFFSVFVYGPILIVVTVALLIFVRGGTPALGEAVIRVRKQVADTLDATFANLRRVRRRGRVRRVESAAARAADAGEKPLSPELVRVAAEALFRLVVLAWNERDGARLATLLGPELMVEWERRLALALRSKLDERLEIVGDVRVEYVGFTADEGRDDTRAVMLIEAALAKHARPRARRQPEPERLCQYWTVSLGDAPSRVLRIEERKEGAHHLSEPIGALTAAA